MIQSARLDFFPGEQSAKPRSLPAFMVKRKSPTASPATRRKARPVAAEHHADNFRLLFMDNPQPMWVYDLGTLEILEVNEAASHQYGYTCEEFLAMKITDLRRKEDVPRLIENISQVRAPWQYSGEWRHLLKDGRTIDVGVRSHTMEFRGRKAALVVVHDITQQKRNEAALKEAEQKYRHIFEKAILGIFQSTPQGRFVSVNESLARMLCYDSPADMIDTIRDIELQFYVDSKRRQEFKQQLEANDVLQGFELEIYRKDRSKMWVSANVRAIRENGQIVCYEGSLEDISQRKLLEEQFRQSQKMEAVGRLAGGVAHDFNNAIGVITGYSELLQLRLPVGDPLHRYADEIAKAGQRAASLTRQLLAFSRKQVIQPEVLDLNTIVGEMDKMLRRLIGEDIQITFSREPRLAPIKADHGQIEQILMNLAVNARDAMPQGGKLFIQTSNVQLDETYSRQHAYVKEGRYVMLSFSDNGCGMDKPTQAKVFEPFFTTKEPGKGTGLGLSTVYGIVKQNGGYIWVYSEPGKGATFRIYFPPAQGVEHRHEEQAVPLPPPSGTETILLVEDEDPLRQLARTCLETGGYKVLAVADGKAAIDVVRNNPENIDLLLTDVIMPGMSGRELADVITKLRPGIKILFMSGYTNDLIAQYGVLEAGTQLLEKPFTLYSLLDKVDTALGTTARANAAVGS
jgi:two-component system cell cycle sensor histidine kinase/response regulator CckA